MSTQEMTIDLDFDNVLALVTSDPDMVDSWISDIERIHHRRLHRLVVGLDVEWRPSFSHHRNPIAILQLCVGRRCLVFQILHAPYIPRSLHDFLGDDSYTFVGVGIRKDIEKLEEEHDLSVEKFADVRILAANHYGNEGLKSAGMKRLADVVLDVDIEKPREVTMSAWDNWNLSFQQIRYAVTDAFVSFEMGRVLEAWQ
ncbi:Werner Syndrome-like exonuclease [Morus notabilis]|uniref:Werner Syndrome-like exonuclease n=1 Tax=Morus notabilis TaxID=981085 RepID=W9SVX0_9ROSA|nr:Werner Syndrome-like exonuclease [Morus notabilis]EXC30707.1 Werner Syndrome-like exonuclease [Morus notabilis]